MNDVRPDDATAAAVGHWWQQVAADRSRLVAGYVEHLRAALPGDHPLADPADTAPGSAPWLLESVLRAVESGPGFADLSEAAWYDAGRRLAVRGVRATTFPTLGRVLVRVVRDASGESWSASMSSGWAAYHMWMQHHLSLGAATVPHVAPTPDAGPTPERDATRDVERSPAVAAVAGPVADAVNGPAADLYRAWGRGWV